MVSPEDRQVVVKLIEDIVHDFKCQIATVCRVLEVSTATYYRWKSHPNAVDGRTVIVHAPSTIALSPEEQQAVIERFNQPDVKNLTPEQAYLKLLDKGEYWCFASTVRRLFAKLGINGDTSRDNVRNNHQNGYNTDELVASKHNKIWSWNGTPLKNNYKQQVYMVYATIDINSRKIVHIDVFDSDCAENAVIFLGNALNKNNILPGTLTLHSDNGSAIRAKMTEDFLALQGVTISHSRLRVSNDNAFYESLFSMLNNRMGIDKRYYRSLDECRSYVKQRADDYNNRYLSGIGFCTPKARHNGKDQELLDRRGATLEIAFAKNPKRWICGEMMNCKRAGKQYLNPSNKPKDKNE